MPSLLKSAWIIAIVALASVVAIDMNSYAAECELTQTVTPIVTPCDDCQGQGTLFFWKCDAQPSNPTNEECGGSSNQDGIECDEDDTGECGGHPTTYESAEDCALNQGGTLRDDEDCFTTYIIAETVDNGDEPICPVQ